MYIIILSTIALLLQIIAIITNYWSVYSFGSIVRYFGIWKLCSNIKGDKCTDPFDNSLLSIPDKPLLKCTLLSVLSATLVFLGSIGRTILAKNVRTSLLLLGGVGCCITVFIWNKNMRDIELTDGINQHKLKFNLGYSSYFLLLGGIVSIIAGISLAYREQAYVD